MLGFRSTMDARARIPSGTQNGGIPIPFRTAGKDSRRVGREMGISHQPNRSESGPLPPKAHVQGLVRGSERPYNR